MELQISRPILLLDPEKCKRNIRYMANKARNNKLIFRPHFKTHQSVEIGDWFRENGVNKITVSSVSMAEYFATHGWDDITIAFPVNLLEIENINKLSSKIKLNILVESIETTKALLNKITSVTGIFIEIDTGDHRTGLTIEQLPIIEKIVSMIHSSKLLKFKGFLTHSGHTYRAESISAIKTIFIDTIEKLNFLKQHFQNITDELVISLGDTPSCSLMKNFNGIDEIRPGNFVFYDLMQYYLGSCSLEDIAVIMVCPVVATYTERKEMVIYGGAVHFSKEFLILDGKKIFGQVVELSKNGWNVSSDRAYLISLSQEHGTIMTKESTIKRFNPGDLIGIVPVHSCLTANLMKSYTLTNGEKITK
jgi:D-serine deaminase-like pyridoxal phosphate-dependent protein